MDYNEAIQDGDYVRLTNIRHFNLDETLDCGQAFRFEKTQDGYTGVAHGRRINPRLVDGDLILEGVEAHEFEPIWKPYFDFGRDYGTMRGFLADHGGPHMAAALSFSPGLRHMRQEPWETLVSFILSQNANIPRIKGMVARISEMYGRRLDCGGYVFPTWESLAGLCENDLALVRCGYRAAYVIDAARRVADGRLDFDWLQNQDTKTVRKQLLQILGVGPKVADCVLLMGFGRVEVCPMDVWINRAMKMFYPDGFPKSMLPYAGIAQQFLFHYVRNL